MQKLFVRVLFACVLSSGAFQAAGVEAALFSPYEGSLQLDPGAVNPELVLRQRLVTVRLDLLPKTPGQEIVLDLFADVAVRAVCERVETNASGGMVWFGRIQDPAGGEVTLAVSDPTLAGSVVRLGPIYHIRPFQDRVHVIREIRLPAQDAAEVFPQGPPSATEQQVVTLVNLERSVQNLQPLVWHDALGTAARSHSEDMALQNYFSHTSLDGRTFSQRITAAGYAYNTCGENIAAGYSTPQAVMNGWMNSPGHRANILSSSYCDIGVGYAYRPGSSYGHYWTQDFGRRQGVSVCPPVVTQFTITATAGLHGRIAPSGTVTVPSGANQSFQITPDAGYRIFDVKIDSVSAGAVATYTFNSVAANHTIEASFAESRTGTVRILPWLLNLLLGE